jgi:hypothetical protein
MPRAAKFSPSYRCSSPGPVLDRALDNRGAVRTQHGGDRGTIDVAAMLDASTDLRFGQRATSW